MVTDELTRILEKRQECRAAGKDIVLSGSDPTGIDLTGVFLNIGADTGPDRGRHPSHLKTDDSPSTRDAYRVTRHILDNARTVTVSTPEGLFYAPAEKRPRRFLSQIVDRSDDGRMLHWIPVPVGAGIAARASAVEISRCWGTEKR